MGNSKGTGQQSPLAGSGATQESGPEIGRRIMKVSFCVHTYNEADALRRLVLSSLPMASVIDEWIILDHRSDDHTAEVLAELAPVLSKAKVDFRVLWEGRDLSASHTFADVRTRTIKAAKNPIVALFDADFLLGPAFAPLLLKAAEELRRPKSPYHSACYAVPCVWDQLETDASCRITAHGRVWVHSRRPRILWRDAVRYEQTGDGGRWEKLVADDPARAKKFHLTPVGVPQRRVVANAVVSCNVKPPERIALRDTMTMFMQDAISAGQAGDWLANYAAGAVRPQPPYPYHKVDLVGWRLFTPNLRLKSEQPVGA